jgi:hypothetical protein
VGAGGLAGFDYPAILSTADRFGVPVAEEDFAGLQLIERWELERLAEDRRRMEEEARRR